MLVDDHFHQRRNDDLLLQRELKNAKKGAIRLPQALPEPFQFIWKPFLPVPPAAATIVVTVP